MHHLLKLLTVSCLSISFIFVQTGPAQEFSFSGKVVDFDDKPISGATVKLKTVGKSTKTADDGSFTLSNSPTAINSVFSSSSQKCFASFRNNNIELQLSKNGPVSIKVFSPGGKTLYQKKTLFDAGSHAVSIPVKGQGIYLIQVKSGEREVTFKTHSLEAGFIGNIHAAKDYAAETLAKSTSNSNFNDSIFVTKDGYLHYSIKMYKKSSQSGMVIRMASKDHPVYTRQQMYKVGSAPFPSCHAASIWELPDGTLLCVFFGGTKEGHKDVEVRLCRRPAGKDKWTAPISIADGILDGTRYSVRNPEIFQTFDGKLILFYRIYRVNGKLYGAMKTSTDGGKTWSESRKIGDKCMGPESNKPVQLEDGTILSPSADRNGVSSGGLTVERSTDNGETWELYSSAEDNIKSIQPCILFHADGSLQMMARGSGRIPTTWSKDKGKTWSKLENTVLPGNWAGIDGVTLRDGRQFLTYNHNPTSGRKGPRTFLTAAISKDGKLWHAAHVLGITSSSQFSYPAVIQSRDGLVHVAFTWHRKTIGHVVINPYKITDETMVAMPDGKWPTSGPLSIGANKDKTEKVYDE